MNSPLMWSSLVLILPMLIVGTVFWLSARTRRGVFFGISVPLDFPDSPRGRSVARRYRIGVVALLVAALLAALPPFLDALPWLPVTAMTLLVAGCILFWQLARKSVAPEAVPAPLERQASLTPAQSSTGWLTLLAAALLPLAATGAYIVFHRAELPGRIPIHYAVNGLPDRWVSSAGASVFTGLGAGVAVVLLLFGSALFLRVTPVAERQRALAILLPTLAALAWIISGVFCAFTMLEIQQPLHTRYISLIAAGQLVLIFAILLWMLRRLITGLGRKAYDSTPDAAWFAGGLFYFNRADAAVIVPKRLGWGWTFNFARPAAWTYLLMVLVFIAVLVTLVNLGS